jgi:hypothetical protein
MKKASFGGFDVAMLHADQINSGLAVVGKSLWQEQRNRVATEVSERLYEQLGNRKGSDSGWYSNCVR